jgi:hypothetical protein
MKIALRYGLIYIGINILWSLMMYVTGMNRSGLAWIFNSIAMLIPVLCITLAVKEYKSTIGQGFMSFSEVFKYGLVITLIGGIGISAYLLLYTGYIDPGFNDYVLNQQIEGLQEAGMSDEQIELSVESFEKYSTPFYTFTFGVLGSLFVGSILSLIMAAVLKKPNPDGIFADTNKLS